MDEQQFCLRWNNFQANITSQFEALRDDEDFTDVTIACEGQRLQAHKVVLSACSPYFKDLFKSNPCSHPIIFMRDVEAEHVVALMEFMYAGEVNVAQAQLSAFLKTAESLKIRGLTDNNPSPDNGREIRDHDTLYLNPSKSVPTSPSGKHQSIAPCSSTVTSSQDVGLDVRGSASPPPSKRQCKADPDDVDLHTLRKIEDAISANASYVLSDNQEVEGCKPKLELPDYLSDDDKDETTNYFRSNNNVATLSGGMEIIPKPGHAKESGLEQSIGPIRMRRRRTSENWLPPDGRNQSGASSPVLSRLRECRERREKDGDKRNRLVKLGEGIEIYEDQLRSVKWSDYRKLTRGLATILFSPAELATCSVTGQRWSRAGSGERPVKPALDRTKVQAIISYVATRFPMVEISRIKQVLAYKCKENSTALKMKAVRYYGDQIPEPEKH